MYYGFSSLAPASLVKQGERSAGAFWAERLVIVLKAIVVKGFGGMIVVAAISSYIC